MTSTSPMTIERVAAQSVEVELRHPLGSPVEGLISFAEAGPHDAPVVVLIPGGGGAVATSAMAPVWKNLAGDYRTLLVETRGAPSVSMEPAGFTTLDMARDVVGLLDHLGIERAFVAGASLGSMISQHVAAELGDRLYGAIFGLSWAGGDPFFAGLTKHLAVLARVAPLEFVYGSSLWAAAGDGFSRWGDPLPPRERAGEFPPLEATARRFEAAATHDARDRLASISRPTLVVSGGYDLMLRPSLGQALAEALPDSRYDEIPGANHMCFNEDPGLFAGICRSFFSAVLA